MPWNRVHNAALNARAKEIYNFSELSWLMAQCGWRSTRLTDDWQGADFVSQHVDGRFIGVQLKSRFYLRQAYLGRNLWIAFPSIQDGNRSWYCLAYDELQEFALANTNIGTTDSWIQNSFYHAAIIPPAFFDFLADHRIPNDA